MKKALITGITGQDGSILAELLLSKQYEVHGLIRRVSSDNLSRINHILDYVSLHYGDLTDSDSVVSLIQGVKPDEIYHLGAMSHVRISFDNPIYTINTICTGSINVFEGARKLQNSGKRVKVYNASSSEMFGDVLEVPQNEKTPFNPQSPYACGKTFAHYQAINYRKAYDLFISNGILFNHETMAYEMPVIMLKDSQIDILPIGDVCRFHTGIKFDLNNIIYQEGKPSNDIKIWDKSGWVDIKWASGYPHKMDKNPRIINARNFVYNATGSHVCIMDDNSEKRTDELKVGDKVKLIQYPNITNNSNITLEEAEWLGMLVGDGNLSDNLPRFTNKNMQIKQHFANLWNMFVPNGEALYSNSKSGFNNQEIGQVTCSGRGQHDYDIYTNSYSPFGHKHKKIPKSILNGSIDVMKAFLIGYNICDGLKKNSCIYKFKNFKTNSPTLAAGLLFLISKVTQQKYNITVEESWKYGKQQFYYSINLLSDNISNIDKYNIVKEKLKENLSQREINKQTNISRGFIRKVQNGYIPTNTHYLELCNNEIKKIINIPNYNGWFFDLETSSGTFHSGIGNGVVHNSGRRGDHFVTKKIVKAAVNIKRGLQKELKLGNLSAKRDWGHAADYMDAAWRILQHDKPDDFVIATGETHSVQEFLEKTFKYLDLDYTKYVKYDSSLIRPSEVNLLIGDASKAKRELGWEPKIRFDTLVADMLEYELAH